MLQITVPSGEFFIEDLQEFVSVQETTLRLEHSLVSLAKWESKWKKPYLSSEKSIEEVIDYIRCMNTTQNVNPLVYRCITEENIKRINDYIEDSMTATWFSEDKQPKTGRKEIITAELIYYWMIAFNIPVEFQKWHLNRLLTLIKVCDIKNTPPKKMSKKELMDRHRALNAARRGKKK